MYKNLITTILILLIAVSTSVGWSAELNKNRTVYPASSNENLLEGYWSSKGITSAYVSYTPIGVTYSITIAPDTIEVGSYIDIPLWKHWGVTGSYGVSVVDTNIIWTTTDDSVSAYVGLHYIDPGDGQKLVEKIVSATSAAGLNTLTKSGENFLTTVSVGDTVTIFASPSDPSNIGSYAVVSITDDTEIKISSIFLQTNSDLDFTIHNNGRETVLIAMLVDSAAGGSTRLGGAAWINFVTGEIDLTNEDDWWERMVLSAAQSSVAATNDILSIRIKLTLPYSQAYRDSEYYKNNQVTK